MTGVDSPTNVTTDQMTEDSLSATVSWNKVEAPLDRYMGRYTSADGDTKEIQVGSENDMITLLDLKPDMEYVTNIWAEKEPQRSKKASTRAVTDINSLAYLVIHQVAEDTATTSWDRAQTLEERSMVNYISVGGDTEETEVGKNKAAMTLTGLKPEYVIFIWTEKGTQSKMISTEAVAVPLSIGASQGDMPPPALLMDGFSCSVHRVSFLYVHATDCSQVQQNRNASSSMYTIYLNGDGSRLLLVYCDMSTDRGRWILLPEWSSMSMGGWWMLMYPTIWGYVYGRLMQFSLMPVSVFIASAVSMHLDSGHTGGLDKLYNLTSCSSICYELRVDLWTASNSVCAVCDISQVASSRDRYRLSVGNRGNAGDTRTYHNGWKFTTWDRDSGVALSNCALRHQGAWWYKNCHLANLSRKHGESNHSLDLNWESWKGHEFSIPFMEMKIHPQSSSNEPTLGRRKKIRA
ncbi:LOW QUALITY PROTEIN: tenascin-N-like [Sylvia borin]